MIKLWDISIEIDDNHDLLLNVKNGIELIDNSRKILTKFARDLEKKYNRRI